MIWLAIIIEGVQQEWPDVIILMILQLVNGLVGWREE